jgi:hypothetical protein
LLFSLFAPRSVSVVDLIHLVISFHGLLGQHEKIRSVARCLPAWGGGGSRLPLTRWILVKRFSAAVKWCDEFEIKNGGKKKIATNGNQL